MGYLRLEPTFGLSKEVPRIDWPYQRVRWAASTADGLFNHEAKFRCRLAVDTTMRNNQLNFEFHLAATTIAARDGFPSGRRSDLAGRSRLSSNRLFLRLSRLTLE